MERLGRYELNSIVVGDCLEVMGQMPDGCCNLVFADPPYNKGKADWDKGHDWRVWMAGAVRVLKFSGALWVSHDDPIELAAISEHIIEVGGPPLVNWITWDKYNGATTNRGYMDGYTVVGSLRSFQQMAEYLIYHAMTTTDVNQYSRGGQFLFGPLRAYLAGEFRRAGVPFKRANAYCGTASMATGHYFARSQWCLPTAEHYASLQQGLNMEAGGNGEYLRREYEDLRPTFNNPGYMSSVWQGPPASKNGHETPKPEWLLERIINTTSKEGDLVADFFMGSGTTAVAADRLGRHWFGCDINEVYVAMALERIEADRQKRSQIEMAI